MRLADISEDSERGGRLGAAGRLAETGVLVLGKQGGLLVVAGDPGPVCREQFLGPERKLVLNRLFPHLLQTVLRPHLRYAVVSVLLLLYVLVVNCLPMELNREVKVHTLAMYYLLVVLILLPILQHLRL